MTLHSTMLIECLACGAPRAASSGRGLGATGDCPVCGYLGWTCSSDVDSATRQMIRSRRL